MKFSEAWLREWVNPAIDTNTLSEQLSMAGLEVDGIETVAGEFSGVVVGEVVECGPHPDADKLQVTKVNVGADELLDIVCGAKNCRQGLKVAVATVGAVLPGDFVIKKAKLRGQPSHGMLCSLSELGMADDSDGILELPQDAPVGQNIRDYLKLDDRIIEVDLTPNRADCLGIKGLAREVGVLNKLSVSQPLITPVAASIADKKTITLSSPQACPRYLGRVVRNVNVKATSPLWLTEKLRRCGVRSIDAVVDITNFVLLELGHPMHAFDLAKIDGDINVRMAEEGEKLVLLDESEVVLKANTLLIADNNKALAMAGIFGGLHSGVTTETKDVFLESAFFAPLAIAGKARQYGLHTDASHRYERGVDPQLQLMAMERATELLLQICGGEAGPVVEAVSEADLPKAATISLSQEKLARILGISIDKAEVSAIFNRLGLEVSDTTDGWQVTVPGYRFDISIAEDLIEEVARVYGYNSIPNLAPKASLKMRTFREAELNVQRLRTVLVDRGYQEAITYSFVDPKVQQVLMPQQQALLLPNPISADMSAMRLNLWPGLLQTVLYNQNRQQSRIRLFEYGLKFIPDAAAEGGVRQVPVIGGVIVGSMHNEHWNMENRNADFYDIKGDVEALLAQTSASEQFRFVTAEHSALHPGQTAAVYRADQHVGYVGALHPEAERKLGIKGKAYLFELDVAALGLREIVQAHELSKYPANRRDLAIVVKSEVRFADIAATIKKVGGNQLVDLKLFDVYTGTGVAEGFKSLAIAVTLQDIARTLEDKDIQQLVNQVVSALGDEFNATLRD
ncbi:MAG: phenylalanine--tRNA ligase subunit beta [Alteromonadaceae bacterium]|jgi:phenylalanyl-tRNA synthetase beta chain|uniref:phenylalanine--tRNA ligase subunit beta n=1 Tax=Rheinheimera aquimaris TaxID=412437 RepID=UPI000C66CD33|nr:phenylalanine--tRNA ligase subunit beta [Rheinheimera aquimaris]MBJ92077.1 phenylalanine--tRNA ligase subunit beta [Alteromonadaceae bacterium]|tara:strand:+ start:2363 stop:4750 length:2388 start_codon:yes stop_codon:yes gene_type:complete